MILRGFFVYIGEKDIMNIRQISKIAENRKLAQDIYDRTPIKSQDTRCIGAVAKLVILAGKKFRSGECYEPHTKHIGCGVYHIWYEKID